MRCARAGRPRWMDRSALWLMFPLRYTNSFVWLYTWPAASTLNVVVDSDIPSTRKRMISYIYTQLVATDPIRGQLYRRETNDENERH